MFAAGASDAPASVVMDVRTQQQVKLSLDELHLDLTVKRRQSSKGSQYSNRTRPACFFAQMRTD